MKTKAKRPSKHRSSARFITRILTGARTAPFPRFIEPQIPISQKQAPSGDGWQFEIKHDGYRVQAHLQGGKPTLLTRSGLDWTGRFRSIANALANVQANDLVLDGEVVVPDAKGVADFGSGPGIRSALACRDAAGAKHAHAPRGSSSSLGRG